VIDVTKAASQGQTCEVVEEQYKQRIREQNISKASCTLLLNSLQLFIMDWDDGPDWNVVFYLQHEDERQRIAFAGWKQVMEYYRSWHLMEAMIIRKDCMI
jgi:hypothetical protein